MADPLRGGCKGMGGEALSQFAGQCNAQACHGAPRQPCEHGPNRYIQRLHPARDAQFSQLKEAIHGAVLASNGLDEYTGEKLDWHLISKFRNEDAKAGR